ncbi:hypothetical protein [Nocardioides sp.]|uniref:hypothetical protein n=1 Tax=Nocardioides sp. TaxID=35761 RepID=UPI002D7EB76D|nr:hypothetical protein [Nocardioides sp.]HET8960817.1 hypothetical protein [Nocardioides sp.]
MRYVWGKGDVVLAGDEPIASAHRAWFRERAEVTIGGVEWLFRAEGSDRVGESQGVVRTRARRRSVWTGRYDIDSAHASYSLGTRSVWSSRLVLTRHGTEIGQVGRSSLWANRPSLTATTTLPPEDAVFVLWLAHLIAAREESGSSSPT